MLQDDSLFARPHDGGTLSGSDGTSLGYQVWRPEGDAEAAVAYLHGVGGHSGQPTYCHFIDRLVTARCAAYGLDLRGFGRSGGRRGHVDRWSDHLADVSLFLTAVRREQPGKALFLFGQSLGGLIALEWAIDVGSELAGVILSAPALAKPNVAWWIPPVVRALAKVAPTLSINPGIDLAAYTRNRDDVAKLEADPLLHSRVTCRFAIEFDAAIDRVQQKARRLQVPVLILIGQADAITPPQGAKTFMERVSIEDKALKIYQGGYHQPIFDTDHDNVLSDIVDWIRARIPPAIEEQ